MFTIGNDELSNCPKVKEQVICNNCGELHNIEYGKVINKDGTEEESKLLGFIHCPQNDATYLVAVNGKDITDRFRKE